METTAPSPGTIEIRRNVIAAAVLGVLGVVLGALFLVRGGVLSIIVGVLFLAFGLVWGWLAWDGRTPLLLVDEQGVRIRLAGTWRGLPWSRIHEIEHTPRPQGVRGWWRDGRLAVMPRAEEDVLATLHGPSIWVARLAQRLYGVPLAVPLGLGTTVIGAGSDLTAALARLAAQGATIVEIDDTLGLDEDEAPAAEPAGPGDAVRDTNPRIKPVITPMAGPTAPPPSVEAPVALAPEPLVASPTPSPLRDATQVVRVDVDFEPMTGSISLSAIQAAAAAVEEDGRPEDGVDGDETQAWSPSDIDPEHGDDVAIVPAPTPVIGPELQAARERIGLSVDQLAERTRIRPHVIEALEVDDFAPCGGDFYARGHLRTLARVLGLDSGPLLDTYDATYADAPVDPRAVFQAELASADAGALRRLKGGPNWSVLVAAVMAIVLVWSVARLVTAGSSSHSAADQGMQLQSGTYGTNPYGKVATPIPVTLDAAGGGASVVIRDANNDVVWKGDLTFGESKSFQVSPPLRIQTSDGSLAVSINGGQASALGKAGAPAQRTYTAN